MYLETLHQEVTLYKYTVLLNVHKNLIWGVVVLSGRFSALLPEGLKLESHFSRAVGTMGNSFTHSCL